MNTICLILYLILSINEQIPSQWSLKNDQNHERKDLEIHFSLIIIQGKLKKCIYRPKNIQKFQDLQQLKFGIYSAKDLNLIFDETKPNKWN